MKIKTLEEQYIFSYNILKVAMSLFSLVWIVSGSVLAIFLKEVFWGGLILIGVGGLIILELLLIRITSGLILINIKLRSNEERRADRQVTYAPLDKLL